MKKKRRIGYIVYIAAFLGISVLVSLAYLCLRTEPDAPKTPANSRPVTTLVDKAPQAIVEDSSKNDGLKLAVDNYLSPFEDRWSVYFEDLQTGDRFCCTQNVTEDTPMVSASLIKLFVMGAVYEQIEKGIISEEAVSEKLTGMITVSDNNATNELIKLLGNGTAEEGMSVVNAFAVGMGCENTSLNRLMLEDNGKQNYTTAMECGTFLRRIYMGQCVSENFSSKMLELLLAQTRVNKIPAGLPPDVKCANKTGELPGISEGDVAIVFTKQGDYILCVLSESGNNAEAIEHIAQIAMIVDAGIE